MRSSTSPRGPLLETNSRRLENNRRRAAPSGSSSRQRSGSARSVRKLRSPLVRGDHASPRGRAASAARAYRHRSLRPRRLVSRSAARRASEPLLRCLRSVATAWFAPDPSRSTLIVERVSSRPGGSPFRADDDVGHPSPTTRTHPSVFGRPRKAREGPAIRRRPLRCS